MTKKDKLQKLLHKLSGTNEETLEGFKSFDEGVKKLKEQLNENIQIATLKEVKGELTKFKSKLDLQPLVEAIDTLKENFADEISSLASQLKSTVSQTLIDNDVANNEEVENKTKEIENKISEVVAQKNRDLIDLGKKISNIISETDKKVKELEISLEEKNKDVVKQPELKENVKNIEEKITKLNKDLISNLGRGGSMNRKITVAGVDVLTRYTDINFTYGTVANDDTQKRVNITFAGTGDVTGAASSVDNRIAFFDGITGKILKDGGHLTSDGSNLKIDTTQIIYLPSQTDYVGTLFLGNGGASLDNTGTQAGDFNTYVGINSGLATTVAKKNTALGYGSLGSTTSGWANTAVGYNALSSGVGTGNLTVSGTGGEFYANTAVGESAMYLATTASYNTSVGTNSLTNLLTGTGNVAFGVHALQTSTAGDSNVAIGWQTLYTSTGSYNTAVGKDALKLRTTGDGATALGYQAGFSDNNVGRSLYIGYQAGYSNVAGYYNVFVGDQAGLSSAGKNSYYDVFIGHEAGLNVGHNEGNIYIGTGSGKSMSTGNYNTFMGYDAGNNALQLATAGNSMALGNGAYTTASNQIVLGNSSITENILFGTLGNTTNRLTKGWFTDLDIRGTTTLSQVAAPSNATVAINATAGNLNGSYVYCITFVTATAETEAGTNSAVVSPVNQQVDLSNIPVSTDSRVTKRRIYRNNTSTSDDIVIKGLVYEIPDNTTTTYTDNIANASLTGNIPRVNTTGGTIYNNAVRIAVADTQSTSFGYLAMKYNTGYANSAFGLSALEKTTTGMRNAAFGVYALQENTTGYINSAFGVHALNSNTTGFGNCAYGYTSLYTNTTGFFNTAYGYSSLISNSTGQHLVALGAYAGAYETGSNGFYVDAYDRTNTAGDKAGALLYGVFDATPANQTLKINANTTIGGTTTFNDNVDSTKSYTTTGVTATDRLYEINATVTADTDASARYPRALFAQITTAGSTNFGNISSVVGLQGQFAANVNITVNEGVGLFGRNWSLESNTQTNAVGMNANLTVASGKTLTATDAAALLVNINNVGTTVATNLYYLRLATTSAGTVSGVTNQYGIYIPSITGASTNWAIYSAGGDSYFTGALTSSQFKLTALNTAPANAGDTGTLGEIRYDASYMYVCTATNTWKRAAISTW